MHFATYDLHLGLQAGVTLACALAFVVIAAWRPRTCRWGSLWIVASLVLLDVALLEAPRADGYRQLHWNWQESLPSSAWPFLVVAPAPGITLASIGVTSKLRPGWLMPCLGAVLVTVAVPAIVFVLGARRTLDLEGWA